MDKIGFTRPGALQMLIAVALTTIVAIGPLFVAEMRPNHEWFVSLYGLPALAATLASLGILLLYIVGFVRYCASKGYSKWLGIFLLLGHLFGFIVLLLLPDIKNKGQQSSIH